MSEVQNLRAFKVTFMSSTKHRGARIKIVDVTTKRYKNISDAWSKMRHTIVLPCDYGNGSIPTQAIEYLVSVGLSVVAQTEFGDDEYIILSDWWDAEFRDLDGVSLDEHMGE